MLVLVKVLIGKMILEIIRESNSKPSTLYDISYPMQTKGKLERHYKLQTHHPTKSSNFILN